MANSRLERIGTIYSRITGLLRSGAMKDQDKPMWYKIYQAFPPKYPPRYDRPPAKVAVRDIYYEEDRIRAKFHRSSSQILGMVNLKDYQTKTNSQKVISYYNVAIQNGLSEDEAYAKAVEQISMEYKLPKSSIKTETSQSYASQSLADTFKEAQSNTINIEDIFKK